MNGDKQTILRRIDKLLRLAKSESNENEAELAARLARKLMLQHAITKEQIEAEIKEGKIGAKDYRLGKQQRWRRRLFNAAAEHCECRSCYYTNSDRVEIYGFAGDIEIALYLYEALANQIDVEVDRHMRAWNKEAPHGHHKGIPVGSRGERTDFCQCAVTRLSDRLYDIRRQARGESPDQHALVAQRGHAVEDWVERTQESEPGDGYSWHKNQAGYEAGDRISIAKGVSGSRGELPR